MKTRILAVLAASAIAACRPGDDTSNAMGGLTIEAQVESVTLPRAHFATVPFKVTRAGSIGEVTVTAGGAPEGVYWSDVVLPAGADRGVLELAAAGDVDLGTTSLTLSAGADGGDGSAKVGLVVIERQPTSRELVSKALAAGAIDYPTSVLYRAYAQVGDPRLPETYTGVDGDEDAGFFDAASDATLPAETRAALEPFLVRPTEPASIYNLLEPANPNGSGGRCTATSPGQTVVNGYKTARITEPLRVWVKCTGNEDLDDILLDSALGYARSFYSKMTATFGEPILDTTSVGFAGNLDTAIDIYIVPAGTASLRSKLTQSGNGTTFGAGPVAGKTSSGYILISRARADSGGFKSTMIHEFFHVLQKAHNSQFMFEGPKGLRDEYWWVEASATWASSFYARSLAPVYVYPRFPDFQSSKQPLHKSFPSGSDDALEMYASFVWGFFQEQQHGGPAIIKSSWDALRPVSSHREATDALDGVFNFAETFHKFAVRNVNEDLPAALALDKRYQKLDEDFPRKGPTYRERMSLVGASQHDALVVISALKAAYYRYQVNSKIKKVVVTFDLISQKEGLDIDGLVDVAGKGWKQESYTGLKQKTFCTTNPEEDLDELILVLSNHDRSFDKQVLGVMRIETFEVPCNTAWSGSFTYTQSDSTGGDTIDIKVTGTVRLEQEEGSPLLTFRPTGTFDYTRDGTLATCTVHNDPHHGTFTKDPAQGVMFIYPETSPPTYEIDIASGPFDTPLHLMCPGGAFDSPFSEDLSLIVSPKDEARAISQDGRTIAGSRVEGAGTTSVRNWTWSLTREN